MFAGRLWKQLLSDNHLDEIAAHIDDWEAIFPSLELAAADRSAILEEAPHSAPAAMMKKWKQMLGKQATYEQLRQVFEECGRIDLVEKIKQLVVDSPQKVSKQKSWLYILSMLRHII